MIHFQDISIKHRWDHLKPKLKVTDFWRRVVGDQNNITVDPRATWVSNAWVHLYLEFFFL